LLPNDLIIIRNYGDAEEDERDIKRAQERQGDVHIKVEIKSNLEFYSLTSSPTQGIGPHLPQIDVQDTYKIRFGRSTYAQKENEITFPMAPMPGPNKLDSTRIAETMSISRVQLVHELFTLKLMPMLHTTSNWDIIGLLGNVRR
jgi:hypothetical protein